MRLNLSPSGCREHLERLLSEETSELEKLEALLDSEHAIISANDIDKLTAAGVERQRCISTLFRIEDERRSICRMMDVEATATGIEQLLKWCDPTRTLRRRWAGCAERATRCRTLNDRNGALVTARLKRVEGLLNVVTQQPKSNATYGVKGGYQSSRAGQVLATSV